MSEESLEKAAETEMVGNERPVKKWIIIRLMLNFLKGFLQYMLG